MEIVITADSNYETGVGQAVIQLGRTGYDGFFCSRDYGSGFIVLGIVFMCRSPDLNFKRRVRFSKKEKSLYMDIMLDYKAMCELSEAEKKEHLSERLNTDVPQTLAKYRIPDFDKQLFIKDWHAWIDQLTW